MPATARLPRLAALPAAALVATMLAAVGPAAAPAVAAPGCLTEVVTGQSVPGLLGATCDDEAPPVMDPTIRVSPAPRTAENWLSGRQVTFAFAAKHTDADADPITFECQFFDTPTAPTAWQACGAKNEATGLWQVSYDQTRVTETDGTPHTFRVRAVDQADRDRVATASCGLGCTPADADLDDFSAPVSTQLRVDTQAPETTLYSRDNLYDEVTPAWPMIRSRSLRLTRSAGVSKENAPVGFECQLDGKPVGCPDRDFQVDRLGPGDHTLSALASDAAGNVDPTAATLRFSVPKNLRAKKGSAWKRFRLGGHFSGDYLETRRKGAIVSLNVKNAQDVRLIAPRGPLLGKVEVRIARMPWKTINLKGATTEKFHVYQVRDPFQAPISGRLQVRAKKVGPNKPVRIDAVLAH